MLFPSFCTASMECYLVRFVFVYCHSLRHWWNLCSPYKRRPGRGMQRPMNVNNTCDRVLAGRVWTPLSVDSLLRLVVNCDKEVSGRTQIPVWFLLGCNTYMANQHAGQGDMSMPKMLLVLKLRNDLYSTSCLSRIVGWGVSCGAMGSPRKYMRLGNQHDGYLDWFKQEDEASPLSSYKSE